MKNERKRENEKKKRQNKLETDECKQTEQIQEEWHEDNEKSKQVIHKLRKKENKRKGRKKD